MRLSVKFSGAVLLLLLVSLGCVAWGVIAHQTRSLHQRALERSQLLLSMGEASREYARQTLSPAVRKAVASHGVGLIFEADSATFVVRGMFDAFRKRQPGYSFREAALNPLNPDNRADDQERDLIEQFRSHPEEKERSGLRYAGGVEVFYVARPVVVAQACLSCHHTPARAPVEVTERYGREHGYGWKVGETVGALIVTVPTHDIRAGQRAVVWNVVGAFAGVALLLVVLLHVLFNVLVNRRLVAIGAVMERVASGPAADGPEPPLSEKGQDEVAALSRGVNHMARAVYDSHRLLEQRVAERTVRLMQVNQTLGEEVRERRRAEAEARRAVDLAETANRAKSLFLANMSHEIRTPMNGILGMTDLALGTNLTHEQQEYLQTVKSSAESLLTILDDILDFSKIEAGKLDLAPAPFRLHDSLGDALKPLALRAHAKGLELAYRVGASVPDEVVGDWGRLRQVIVNLVGNAIKFTEKGEVVLTVGQPAARSEGPDKLAGCPTTVELRFEVRDTGIGIAQEKQQAIFAPFVQADGSTTRKYGGTGLGLSISSRLVELMGGRIEVRSAPGTGSTFSFTVQLAAPEGAAPPRAVAAGEQMRVLVVADNATCREILAEMLAGWRLQPATAERGEAALEELEQAARRGQGYDLLLVDADLGAEDGGLALVEEVRRRPPLARVAAILLSSAHRAGNAERGQALGVAGRLIKPVKPSDLFDAIVRALDARAAQAVRQEAPGRANGAAAPTLPTGLRVLLAEDNVINQRLAVRLLEKAGCRVHVAANGQEALEALAAAPFDVVLMDVQMPVMGGFEATAAIRAREAGGAGKRIPIVAMTANAMAGDREACLAAGMDAYVAKPVQPRQLFEVMAQAMQDHRVEQPSAPG
jgi:signal transduction histidine kinase/DNA-binding response OmpR family regulator